MKYLPRCQPFGLAGIWFRDRNRDVIPTGFLSIGAIRFYRYFSPTGLVQANSLNKVQREDISVTKWLSRKQKPRGLIYR